MSDTYQAPAQMRVSRINIGRVYNLGNYEHVRYELCIDIPAGENASTAIIAAERLIEGLRPDRSSETKADLDREAKRIADMRTMCAADFERRHGQPVGGATAYIERCVADLTEKTARMKERNEKQARARQLFDDLGGASQWKDAKLSWDDNCERYDDE